MVIDEILNAWTKSKVDQVVVVLRADDKDLFTTCGKWNVKIVQPSSAPRDMKESVQIGLRFLNENFQISKNDRCFIAPADIPKIRTEIVDGMIEAGNDDSIIVPFFGKTRGHPALFPWELTNRIFDLGDDEGVNKIVESYKTTHVQFDPSWMVSDIDTPTDYRQSRS